MADEDILRNLVPDFPRLEKVNTRAVSVTCRGGTDGYDFSSRFFAPVEGVNEDPVTGSVHCALTPYWSAKLGKTEMKAFQASAHGGEMRLKLAGERVFIYGRAVTVLRGELDA